MNGFSLDSNLYAIRDLDFFFYCRFLFHASHSLVYIREEFSSDAFLTCFVMTDDTLSGGKDE